MFNRKIDPHALVENIHQELKKIQKKFGCSNCLSYRVLPNSTGKTMMDLEIKAAQELSQKIPPKIIGWSPQKITKKVLPILSDLAST